jgi:hypothetical protein
MHTKLWGRLPKLYQHLRNPSRVDAADQVVHLLDRFRVEHISDVGFMTQGIIYCPQLR